MPSLKDTIAAIVSDVARGRVQADIASTEVALFYSEHPILREFPLPYMTIDRMEIDLKLALEPGPATRAVAAGTQATQRAEQLRAVTVVLDGVPALLKRHAIANDTFDRVWTKSRKALMKELGEHLSAASNVPHAVRMAEISCRINGAIRAAVAADPVATKATRDAARLQAVEHDVVMAIEPILNVVAAHDTGTDPGLLNVLLSPAELKDVELSKLTTIHMVLVENDKRLNGVAAQQKEGAETTGPR